MKHSSPTLLFGFIPLMSILIIASVFLVGIWFSVFIYLFAGFLVWIIGIGEIGFFRTLTLWYPAILLDKQEMLDKR